MDILVTNNKIVQKKYETACKIEFVDGKPIDVLYRVRDLVHAGNKLLSHPLSGSIKPNESPYKSILVSEKADSLDLDSLKLVENSIATIAKFDSPITVLPKNIMQDFQTIDYTLISSALSNNNLI